MPIPIVWKMPNIGPPINRSSFNLIAVIWCEETDSNQKQRLQRSLMIRNVVTGGEQIAGGGALMVQKLMGVNSQGLM